MLNPSLRQRLAAQSVLSLSPERIERFQSGIAAVLDARGQKSARVEEFRAVLERQYQRGKRF